MEIVQNLGMDGDNGEIFFYEKGKLVGKLDLLMENNIIELRMIESYKKGLGTVMIDYLKDFYGSSGVREIYGICGTGSLGFYQKINAEIIDDSGCLDDSKGEISFKIYC